VLGDFLWWPRPGPLLGGMEAPTPWLGPEWR
jgi:hypothetical protein